MHKNRGGFTIVELLIVIVVITILAAITLVAFNGIQQRGKDSAMISKIKGIAKALELYKLDNGFYPKIPDASGGESSCGSQTENWGHCDRLKLLADAINPYTYLDPVSLSSVTIGANNFYYTSQAGDSYQTYGMSVLMQNSESQNDGGYFTNMYEVGPKPAYCKSKYSGANGSWRSYTNVCVGGN